MKILPFSFFLAVAAIAVSQQAPSSLGDVARKNRRTPAPTKKVLTNEDISNGAAAQSASTNLVSDKADLGAKSVSSQQLSLTPDQLETIKEKVRTMKGQIVFLEQRREVIRKRLQETKDETMNCAAQKQLYGYSGCDALAEDRAALNQAESRLKESKEQLAKLQNQMRKLGYGSSVYDAN